MSATRVTRPSESGSPETRIPANRPAASRHSGNYTATNGNPRGIDDIHLSADEMDRLLQLDGPYELAFEWVAHLIFCNLCRRRLARHCPEESRWILDRFLLLGEPREDPVRVHPSAYDRVLDRILERVSGSVS